MEKGKAMKNAGEKGDNVDNADIDFVQPIASEKTGTIYKNL